MFREQVARVKGSAREQGRHRVTLVTRLNHVTESPFNAGHFDAGGYVIRVRLNLIPGSIPNVNPFAATVVSISIEA